MAKSPKMAKIDPQKMDIPAFAHGRHGQNGIFNHRIQKWIKL